MVNECQWPEHWPTHATRRGACHEGDCTRCAMEQEHCESHEGEPCPWDANTVERDWNVATSERSSMRGWWQS